MEICGNLNGLPDDIRTAYHVSGGERFKILISIIIAARYTRSCTCAKMGLTAETNRHNGGNYGRLDNVWMYYEAYDAMLASFSMDLKVGDGVL